LIERKDGETDASWIGRLEAAYKALIPACESLEKKLKQAQEEHLEFLAFWAAELDRFPCLHEEAGPKAHASSPPMMWAPELLGCIIQRAVKDRLASQNVAENPIDK
jgi:hypothetical protein